jgi:hypothetical protein
MSAPKPAAALPAHTRQIIVLDATQNAAGNLVVRAAFWLVAPASRLVLPNPSAQVTQVPTNDAVVWGVTPQELVLLQMGSLVEQIGIITVAASGQTAVTVQTALQAQYTSLQNAYNTQVFTANFVGSSYDGTTWTAGP